MPSSVFQWKQFARSSSYECDANDSEGDIKEAFGAPLWVRRKVSASTYYGAPEFRLEGQPS